MHTTVADVDLETLVDTGLGNTCYLLDLGDGRALAVDPPGTCAHCAWQPIGVG